MARTNGADPIPATPRRSKHDALVGAVRTTARGEVGRSRPGAGSSGSRRSSCRRCPPRRCSLPVRRGARWPPTSTSRPARAADIVRLGRDAPGIALGTAQGVVKRVTTDYPARYATSSWSRCATATASSAPWAATGDEDLVFITTDAQLLRFGAGVVRPQGRAAGGMAGIKLAPGAGRLLRRRRRRAPTRSSSPRPARPAPCRAPSTGRSRPPPTPSTHPRAGHRRGAVPPIPKGEDTLVLAWAAAARKASGANGVALELPEPDRSPRRVGNRPAPAAIARIAGPPAVTGPCPLRHGVPAPDACSVGFDPADVPAYGTAARRSSSWRSSSPVPGDAMRPRSRTCRRVRFGARRRLQPPRWTIQPDPGPGRHPDDSHDPVPAGHTAYLAWAGEHPWLLQGRVTDPAALLESTSTPSHGVTVTRWQVPAGYGAEPPVLLVCTNGRRDVCCAVRGRPVALDAAALAPGRVWEASHTGGHRFAPTGVLLPHGATLARLDAGLAGAPCRGRRGERCPRHCSARSTTAAAAYCRPARRPPSPTCAGWPTSRR